MSARQSLVHSWRSVRRAPLFGATVILTLTIGLGSAAAIFAIVNAVLLRPLPYGHPEQLVGVWHDMPAISLTHAEQTAGTYFTYKKFSRTLAGIAVYDDGSVNVVDPSGRANPERLAAGWTSANLAGVLEVQPILGRWFNDAEDAPKGPDVAVISEAVWRTRFGADRSVIGKRLEIGGKSTEIIGVMPSLFRFPLASTRIWLPMQLDPNNPYPGGFNYRAVARLAPGVTPDAAQRELKGILPRLLELYPNFAPGVTSQMVLDQAKPTPSVVPMRDDVVGDVGRTLWMVAATALLVLLVTGANVANLLLVRADGRHRELSVRAALGAGQRRVLLHFFTESALLAGISCVLGIGVAAVAIRLLVNAGPANIPRLAEVHVDGWVIAFTFVIGAVVALACSAIPAVRFLRADPLAGLRDGGRSGTAGARRQRARSALVAAQMAFALVVLAASGLLLRSYARINAVRPGFSADGVATLWVSLPEQRYAADADVVRFFARLTERAATVPGVSAVGLTSRLPLVSSGLSQNPFYPEGDDTYASKIPPLSLYTTTDAGYFAAMKIPLLAGRMFDRLEAQRDDEAIISSETAKLFFHDSTGRSAIGKRFQAMPNGVWHTVIGVVGSVRDTSLAAPPARVVYFPEAVAKDSMMGQFRRGLAVVAHTSGDVAATTRALQQVIRDMDPTLPTFGVRSMREAVAQSMARLSFTMVILGVAAAVTLVLGVIGLYGVIAYIVTLRTRELGVRIALGAQPSAVARMVAAQGLAVSGVGIVVGLALVLLVARFLRSFLFEVAPTDPLTLGAATGLLLVFALLASWIPARRAAQVNPTEALRAD